MKSATVMPVNIERDLLALQPASRDSSDDEQDDAQEEKCSGSGLRFSLTSTIDPDCTAKVAWDGVVVLFVAYVSLTVPVQLSFGTLTHLQAIDVMADFIFLGDIYFTFRTGFANKENGKMVTDKKEIAKAYLRTWLLIDLLASFPTELTFLIGSETNSFDSEKSNGLRFLKLMRVLRLLRLSTLWQFLQRFKFTALFRLLRLFGMFLLVVHWVGCMWWAIPQLEEWWYDAPPEDSAVANWVAVQNLADNTYGAQFVASLYWAFATITTVGYGDIHPISTLEQLFSIIVMAIGAVIYSTLFGSMTALISAVNMSENRYREKMDEVNGYLRSHNCPEPLQKRVRGYYNFLWDRHQNLHGGSHIDDLPVGLQSQVAKFMHERMLQLSPVLRSSSTDFQQLLALKLTQQIALPDEIIYQVGEPATQMLFVKHGCVAVLKSSAMAPKTAPNRRPKLDVTHDELREQFGRHNKFSMRSLLNLFFHDRKEDSTDGMPTSPSKSFRRKAGPGSHHPPSVLSWREPGGFMGEESILAGDPSALNLARPNPVHVTSAQATDFCELFALPAGDLVSLVSAFPAENVTLQLVAGARMDRVQADVFYDDDKLLDSIPRRRAVFKMRVFGRVARSSMVEMNRLEQQRAARVRPPEPVDRPVLPPSARAVPAVPSAGRPAAGDAAVGTVGSSGIAVSTATASGSGAGAAHAVATGTPPHRPGWPSMTVLPHHLQSPSHRANVSPVIGSARSLGSAGSNRSDFRRVFSKATLEQFKAGRGLSPHQPKAVPAGTSDADISAQKAAARKEMARMDSMHSVVTTAIANSQNTSAPVPLADTRGDSVTTSIRSLTSQIESQAATIEKLMVTVDRIAGKVGVRPPRLAEMPRPGLPPTAGHGHGRDHGHGHGHTMDPSHATGVSSGGVPILSPGLLDQSSRSIVTVSTPRSMMSDGAAVAHQVGIRGVPTAESSHSSSGSMLSTGGGGTSTGGSHGRRMAFAVSDTSLRSLGSSVHNYTGDTPTMAGRRVVDDGGDLAPAPVLTLAPSLSVSPPVGAGSSPPTTASGAGGPPSAAASAGGAGATLPRAVSTSAFTANSLHLHHSSHHAHAGGRGHGHDARDVLSTSLGTPRTSRMGVVMGAPPMQPAARFQSEDTLDNEDSTDMEDGSGGDDDGDGGRRNSAARRAARRGDRAAAQPAANTVDHEELVSAAMAHVTPPLPQQRSLPNVGSSGSLLSNASSTTRRRQRQPSSVFNAMEAQALEKAQIEAGLAVAAPTFQPATSMRSIVERPGEDEAEDSPARGQAGAVAPSAPDGTATVTTSTAPATVPMTQQPQALASSSTAPSTAPPVAVTSQVGGIGAAAELLAPSPGPADESEPVPSGPEAARRPSGRPPRVDTSVREPHPLDALHTAALHSGGGVGDGDSDSDPRRRSLFQTPTAGGRRQSYDMAAAEAAAAMQSHASIPSVSSIGSMSTIGSEAPGLRALRLAHTHAEGGSDDSDHRGLASRESEDGGERCDGLGGGGGGGGDGGGRAQGMARKLSDRSEPSVFQVHSSSNLDDLLHHNADK